MSTEIFVSVFLEGFPVSHVAPAEENLTCRPPATAIHCRAELSYGLCTCWCFPGSTPLGTRLKNLPGPLKFSRATGKKEQLNCAALHGRRCASNFWVQFRGAVFKRTFRLDTPTTTTNNKLNTTGTVLVTRYSTMQHKRKQQPSEAGQNPLKRQKSTTNQKNAPSKKRKVAASALPWKKVEVPEMFDDAEGFYGLEVIEGVDVIKDGENIEFVRIPDLCSLSLLCHAK